MDRGLGSERKQGKAKQSEKEKRKERKLSLPSKGD